MRYKSGTKEYNRWYYLKNQDKLKRVRAKWYQANKERATINAREYYIRTFEAKRNVRTRWYREIRKKILNKLGNKCILCGFDNPWALQVDHINGGGTKEIKKQGGKKVYYQMVLEDINGKYQLLCANCNWIKRHENNENHIVSKYLTSFKK